MKVVGPWLTRAATQTACAMLTEAGYQALLVGGCVRNALLGAPVSDIDIATDARPDVVLKLAKAAGLRAIPTGIDHGTVTVVIDNIPHEITTFRKDVETDGRRAVVAFATDVAEDARRRDFTMNALYAQADGTVVDPLGGLADLRARRLRFIDDAEDRIREDYLRILRYFRFHAWYGDPSAGMDPEALAAIAAHSAGLETLSKERIGAELLKLLAAADPAPALATMRQTGVLPVILPGSDDKSLASLVHLEAISGLPSDALTRLAALGGMGAAEDLRLSKKQTAKLEELRGAATGLRPASELGYRIGAAAAQQALLLRAALLETPLHAGFQQDAVRGADAHFPVAAADLMPRFQGAALGQELRRLEQQWIASDFRLSADDLLK
ncbi:CCA tRNA nucleotidyltransferase [Cognatishimia sp. SS12]|uniref:CCA tRNA nucleotidyltransferase n=1 Tax=Cognatishimia sp. SS12 TaxID=2979465 RepID=UPI00232EB1B1|nr:CCA tRNA nucleotidyltransferase [Cognatishimia sp. SS12]MDC0737715.1 CCA tRNA nucleotidyltransferase [Cognatishimia sp. SS12]